MNIQLNTDNRIQGSDGMAEWVDAMATQYLGRFDNELTRLEIHLSDANGDKHGCDDKHCAIEARPRSGQAVGVSHRDEDVEKALRGACSKMRTRLDHAAEACSFRPAASGRHAARSGWSRLGLIGPTGDDFGAVRLPDARLQALVARSRRGCACK